MVLIKILHTSKKELGQNALRLGSYCSFNFPRDLLRVLQSQIWGTKSPQMGPKNGGQEKLVHRAIEHFTIFLEM